MPTPPKFEDTLPVDATPPKFEDTLPVEVAPPKFEDTVPVATPGKLESFARGAAQGLSFGFSDEITGAVEAALTNKTYEQARDEARAANKAAEEANPKTFMTGDIGGSIAVSLVPFLNVPAKTVAGAVKAGALVGGATGGVQGLGKAEGDLDKQAMEALKAAGYGAAIGGAASGVITAIGKKVIGNAQKAVIAEESLDDVVNGFPVSEGDIAIQAAAVDEPMARSIQQRANDLFDNLPGDQKAMPEVFPKDFINIRLGRKPNAKMKTGDMERFKEVMGQWNDDTQQQIWEGYLKGKALKQAGVELRKQSAKSITGLDDPMEEVDPFVTKLMAGSQIAEKTDDAAGTNFTDAVYGLSHAERKTTVDAYPFQKALRPIRTRIEKAFGDDKNLLYRVLDRGEVDNKVVLNADQKAVVGEIKDWFEASRAKLNQLGLNIKIYKDGHYVPHQQLGIGEAKVKLLDTLDNIIAKYGDNVDMYAEKLPRDLQDYKDALDFLSDNTDFISIRHTRKFLKELGTSGWQKKRLTYDGSAAFRREGSIPTLLQETDVIKLMSKYIVGNLKAVHFREPLERLQYNIGALRAAGMNKTAEVWDAYAQQMAGKSSGFRAKIEAASNAMKVTGQKIANEWGMKKLGQSVENLPEFISWSTAQIYTNYLGFRFDAPIRNMTQTWLVTAPEIGWKEGVKLTAKGWQRAIKARAAGVKAGAFLRERGLAGAQYKGPDAVDAIERGMQVANAGKVVRALDWTGQKGLLLYSMTDDANRFITYHIAQELADDILKGGVAKYQGFMKRVPGGFRTEMMTALQRGQEGKFREMLTKYLVEKTQFNYTRADLSIFGREYGRLATMFTKWPTMIVGDMARTAAKEEGLRRATVPAAKYLAPLATLAVGDWALEQMDLTNNPVKKAIIGKNLIQNAPAMVLKDLAVPPLGKEAIKAAKTVTDIAQGDFSGGHLEGLLNLAQGELGEASKNFSKGVGGPFLPGGFIPVTYNRIQKLLDEED